MDDYQFIGKRIPVIDAPEKVTGEAKYTGDLKFSHLLYGKILRSPHPHAKILNIDVSRARKIPGVKAVVTAEQTPKRKVGTFVVDQFFLAVDKVRYIGEEVAAVAAVDEETAEEALDLITVDYEPLPAVFDMEEAVLQGAPRIHEEAVNNVAVHLNINRGDIIAGFKESDYVFEERFTSQIVHQGYMEPMTSVASFDIHGRLTLWAPVQHIYLSRGHLAKALDMPVAAIRIIQPKVGGGFGGKSPEHGSLAICCILAKESGRPVKITLTREEEFIAGRPRVGAVIYLKMGVKKDGTFMAKEARIFSDNGAYSGKAPSVMTTTAIRPDACYRYKNVKAEARLVYTNKVPTGGYRGFGNPQMAFAVESLIDTIAHELQLDPLEIRLKNAVEAGMTTVHGWQIQSCGYRECITRAADAAEWKKVKEGKGLSGIGIGIAGVSDVSGNRHFGYDGSNILLRIAEGGRVSIASGEGDLGQGAPTILAQIAAEELGIPMKDIEVSAADTDSTLYCMGCFANRVTTLAGNAVKLAAADAKKQLFEIAAQLMGANPEDFDCREAKVFVKGSPEKVMTVAEVIRAGLIKLGKISHINIIGRGSFDPYSEIGDPVTKYGNFACTYQFGAHAAVVKVCEETGHVRVLDYAAAHDVGRAINRLTLEGQIEGGVTQALGYTLWEEMLFRDGKVLNPNFTDYKIPLALDLPPIKVIIVEPGDPMGPFGAKGIGQTCAVPTAPAIANAIFDAVGVRITDLPITPEKILKGLRAKKMKKEMSS